MVLVYWKAYCLIVITDHHLGLLVVIVSGVQLESNYVCNVVSHTLLYSSTAWCLSSAGRKIE